MIALNNITWQGFTKITSSDDCQESQNLKKHKSTKNDLYQHKNCGKNMKIASRRRHEIISTYFLRTMDFSYLVLEAK